MKLAIFNDHRFGRVEDDRIIDLTGCLGQTLLAQRPAERVLLFIEQFDDLKGKLADCKGPSHAISAVQLRAPVPRPGKILMGLGTIKKTSERRRARWACF